MIQLVNGEKKSVVAQVRGHKIVADVSTQMGSEDLGMNPHELLESALAACTSITVQMYARHKNIDLQDMKIQVTTVSEGRQSVISVKIEFVGALTPEEKDKLLEIAGRCPIHRLLESQITIQTDAV